MLPQVRQCALCQSRAGGPRLRQVLEDLREAARLEALREAQRQRVGVAGARVGLALHRRQPRQTRLLLVHLGPGKPLEPETLNMNLCDVSTATTLRLSAQAPTLLVKEGECTEARMLMGTSNMGYPLGIGDAGIATRPPLFLACVGRRRTAQDTGSRRRTPAWVRILKPDRARAHCLRYRYSPMGTPARLRS